MPTRRITAPASRLLEAKLNSFEKLEISLALHRAMTHTSSVAELSSKLELSSHVVEHGLDELVRAGMVQLTNGVARLNLDAQDIAAMDEIVAVYDEDRLLVVQALTQIAMNKIRGMAAHAFADAFQLRKKKEDGDG